MASSPCTVEPDDEDILRRERDRPGVPVSFGGTTSKSILEMSELERCSRGRVGGDELSGPARDSPSSCQLMRISSVNKLRIVNKLDRVPPLPTSFSSWYPFGLVDSQASSSSWASPVLL